MARDEVTIEIRGVDKASGALGRVGTALGRIATIAGGLIAFRTFERIARGLFDMTKQAAEAYEWFDRIKFSLEEMSRAELLTDVKVDLGPMWRDTIEFRDAIAGAKEKAEELMGWVIKLSLASPFTAEDVNQMFRLTRAYGFSTKEAQVLTGQIMDFAAATGFGSQVLERLGLALGQVRQRGRLAGEEIRQLINVGIPVRDIVAKAFNVTTGELEDMIRKGLVPAEPALAAIVDWMQRFDGASERAVQTWWGLIANFKDVKDLNMIRVFDGIANALHPGLSSLFDLFTSEKFMSGMEGVGKAIGAMLSPLVEGIPDAAENFGYLSDALGYLGSGIISPGTAIANLLSHLGMIDMLDIPTIAGKIDSVVTTFENLSDGMAGLADAWIGPIKEELPNWLNSLGTIQSEGISAFLPMWENFVDSLTSMSESAAPIIMQDITDTLDNMEEWWTGGASEAFAEITEFLLTLGSGGVIGGLVLLTTAIGTLSDVLSGEDPGPRLAGMVEVFKELADELADTEIFQGFAESLSMVDILSQINAEQFAFTHGEDIAGGMLDGMRNGLYTEIEGVSQEMVDTLNRAYADPAAVWANTDGALKMELAGVHLQGALGNSLFARLKKDEAKYLALLDHLIDRINEKLGVESPSKVTREMGIHLGEGLLLGWEDTLANANVSATLLKIP